MAAPISSIESHPQRDRIIKALADEEPYRVIEKWTVPRVTIGTLSRFKARTLTKLLTGVASAQSAVRQAIANNDPSCVSEAAKAVTQAALTVAVDPFLSRSAYLDSERARVKGKAEQAENLSTWATLDRNDLAALELHAKLAGRLDSGTNIQIQVVVPATPGAAPPDDWDGVTIDLSSRASNRVR